MARAYVTGKAWRHANPLCYEAAMGRIEDIEKAVAELSPEELARFSAWFEEFEAARFDERIERDAKAGKLDELAEQALADYRAGRAREI